MQTRIHTLKNGLRVVLIPVPRANTATVMVMTGTGSRYETERENGLAHFLEHMFFKGTSRRPTARAISEELDAIGSEYNAFTAKERTAYFAKVSAKYLDTALDVISDIFLHSTLPGREIAKERGAIIQEIDMYEDMPMRTVDTVFDALRFGSTHPLGRTILGPKENIRAFKRSDFVSYFRHHYTPLNTVVCVAGSFSEPKVLKKIRSEFGRLESRTPPSFAPYSDSQTAPRVAIKEKKTDQTQFIIGTPGYPIGHPDEFAADVLANVLGGGMSSRLFTEVREKRGLAYYIRAWHERYPDTGSLVVQAGVAHDALEKAIKTILGEFRKIKRKGLPVVELSKAKAHIRGTLTLSLETSDAIAEQACTSLIHSGKIRSAEETLAATDDVSAADVERVARDLLQTRNLNLAVIGPHPDPKKLRELLRV